MQATPQAAPQQGGQQQMSIGFSMPMFGVAMAQPAAPPPQAPAAPPPPQQQAAAINPGAGSWVECHCVFTRDQFLYGYEPSPTEGVKLAFTIDLGGGNASSVQTQGGGESALFAVNGVSKKASFMGGKRNERVVLRTMTSPDTSMDALAGE
jgi:hypothetical protein